MGSDIVRVPEKQVTNFDDPKVIEAIKQTVAKGATDAQLLMFLNVCRASGLNPWLKEIWFVSQTGAIMAARDGYLRVANEHPQFDGMETRVERDQSGTPIKAVCTVWRKDRGHPIICEAYYNEYVKQSQVWQTYKSAMIGKVAEVLALKRSFAINGVVTEEEISDTPRGSTWQDTGSQAQADAVATAKLAAAGIKDDRVAISETLREIKRVLSEYSDSKQVKGELLQLAFGTHTWARVEELEAEILGAGLRAIAKEIAARSEKAEHLTEEQLFRSLDKFKRLDAFSKIKERIGELAYYRILKAHGVEKSNQFKDLDDEWAAYLEMSKYDGMDAFDKHMAETPTIDQVREAQKAVAKDLAAATGPKLVPSHVRSLEAEAERHKKQFGDLKSFWRIVGSFGYGDLSEVPADEAPAILDELKKSIEMPVSSGV